MKKAAANTWMVFFVRFGWQPSVTRLMAYERLERH
jgi:hypothetical protein